jgi:hypothetical protein
MHARRILSVAISVFFFAIACSRIWGAGTQYGERGKRDPFVPIVTGEKNPITNLEDIDSIDDVKLEGIVTGPKGDRMAVLNGELVKEKAVVGCLEIKDIGKKSVKLAIGGSEYDVDLRKEE